LKQGLQLNSHLNDWLKIVPSRKDGVQMSPLEPLATVQLQMSADAETTRFETYPTSTAEYLVRSIKTHRTFAFAVLAVVVCGAIGVTYFLNRRANPNVPSKSATLIAASANPTPNRGTTNDEAYRVYLQGKNLVNQESAEADKKAIEYFEQAIRLDPNYAQAYAGLAKAYLGLWGLVVGPQRIQVEKAKQAVNKALELDSKLAEAYAVRGMINILYEWDFVTAEKDLTTAIELEPNNDTAQSGHAFLCVYTGRFEQALKEIETAQAIVPGAARHERDRGRILYYARRYDEAIVQFARSLELKPDTGTIWLSRAHEMKGDYAAAFEAFIKTIKDPQRIEAYRSAYETGGLQGVKWKFLEFSKLDEQKGESINNYKVAIAFAQLGENDQALAYLKKLAEERSWQIAFLNVDPQVDPLRGDPRFDELLRLVRH